MSLLSETYAPSTPLPAPDAAYGDEYDAAMHPGFVLEQQRADARVQATQDAMTAALAHIGGLQNPSPAMPIPPTPSPGAAGIAGFFAHLNAAQTGSGLAPTALVNTLANATAYQHQVAAANAESSRQFATTKLEAQERTYETYLKLMTEQAVDAGNLPAAYEHQKDLYKLGEKQHKRQADEALAAKEKLSALTNSQILARGLALQRAHAALGKDALAEKEAYQSWLMKNGMKTDPAVAAQERVIYANYHEALITARQNAQTTMTPFDPDGSISAQLAEDRDAALQSVWANARSARGSGSAPSPTIGGGNRPHSNADPLGMNGGK